MKQISVIIPAYWAEQTICRAIDSVLSQTVPAAEIIVVDDGSPDDIHAALAVYGKRITLVGKQNGGASSARNLGIKYAKGHLIAFLDADDYWEPQKLERHLELYERYPYLGMSCSRYYDERPGEQRCVTKHFQGFTKDQFVDVERRQTIDFAMDVFTTTVVVPSHLLVTERFDTSLKTCEDIDLWIRLTRAAPVYCISEPLATAVLEDGSLSRSGGTDDCRNMLDLVRRYRQLLGPFSSRFWESRVLASWGRCDECPYTAIPKMIRSLALWPLPFPPVTRGHRFGRLKRLAVLISRLAQGRRCLGQ